MATRTVVVGEFDNGSVRFEYDYDDALMRLVAVRCINLTGQLAFAEAVQIRKVDNQSVVGRKYQATFTAGTTEIAVPTTQSLKLQFDLDAKGRLDGVVFRLSWPWNVT